MTGPAPMLRQLVARLANSHGGVEYDAYDRNATLIEACCLELGVPAFPSTEVPPRTIRGRTPDIPFPPTPPGPEPGPGGEALTDAIHTALCPTWKPSTARHQTADRRRAATLTASLEAAGWLLVRGGHDADHTHHDDPASPDGGP